MSRHGSQPVYTEEAGIECTPKAFVQTCAGCLSFCITLVAIASLGVIAGGSFWAAQAMSRLTDGENILQLQLCCPYGATCTSFTTEPLSTCPESPS